MRTLGVFHVCELRKCAIGMCACVIEGDSHGLLLVLDVPSESRELEGLLSCRSITISQCLLCHFPWIRIRDEKRDNKRNNKKHPFFSTCSRILTCPEVVWIECLVYALPLGYSGRDALSYWKILICDMVNYVHSKACFWFWTERSISDKYVVSQNSFRRHGISKIGLNSKGRKGKSEQGF